MPKFAHSFPINCYTLASLLIVFWWLAAFHSEFSQSSPIASYRPPTKTPHILLNKLSTLDRPTLIQALGGDTAIMSHLMKEWEVDDQLLEKDGLKGVQKLSSNDRTFLINFPALPEESDSETFRLLPQTHFSASILLALLPPSQIVALPSGIRKQSILYPIAKTEQIPINAERFQSERIYAAKPHLAFVASYSDPSMLNMMKKQGIEMRSVNPMTTLSELKGLLLKIGEECKRPLKAKFLSLFIEAAMLHIDNRLRALDYFFRQEQRSTRILYLNGYHYTSAPTTKSISGQLLQRALSNLNTISCPVHESEHAWSIPFGEERINHLNPDYIIISTMTPGQLHKCGKPVFYLDYTVQDSPTQYVALAYFDLFSVLAQL